MQYKDLNVGDNFKFVDNQQRTYKKITPVEDKWGNLFMAVSEHGSLLEVKDFLDSDIVVKLENENIW